MILIDIDGPSAIGKTTLIKSLYENIPGSSSVNELLMQKPNPYCNWKTPEEFLKKQLWFFEHTIQRYIFSKPVPSNQILQINDIGITDVIIHTLIYPIANNLSWNVFTEFKNSIINNYPNLALANDIFYLYASENTIANRMKNDTSRVRNAFESNMRLFPYQKDLYFDFMSKLPEQIHCINAEKSTCTLTRQINKKLSNQMKSPSILLYDILLMTDSRGIHRV